MGYFANPKRVFIGMLATSASVIYTAPTATTFGVQPKSIIKEILVANTDTAERTYTMYIVPAGSIPDVANCIFSAITIAASTTHRLLLSSVLEADEMLQAMADVVNKITVSVSVIELS